LRSQLPSFAAAVCRRCEGKWNGLKGHKRREMLLSPNESGALVANSKYAVPKYAGPGRARFAVFLELVGTLPKK